MVTSSQKRYIWLGAFVAMVAVAWLAWHYAGTEAQRPALPPPSGAGATAPKDARPATIPVTPATGPQIQPGAVADKLMTAEEGDQAIDEIIRSEKPIPEMARDLNRLVKQFNGEAQVNASRHLVNLTSDEDYGLITEFLLDQKMNPEVIEVLFSDLMNRKRELQLPLFMNILKNPQHPQNEQVRHVMTILASEDFGNDYAAWDRWASEELKRIQSEQ
jgi:hypothetical protein